MVKIVGEKGISLSDLEVSYKDKIEFLDIEEGDKISLLSDNMFKTMFQNENRLKYSAKLISYLVEVDYEVLLSKLQLVKNSFSKKKSNEKNRSGDYVAEINGSFIAIEVNNNGSLSIMERNMEYAHRLYASQIRRGNKNKKKKSNYSQVILININNFSFKGYDKIIDIFYNRNDDNIILSKKIITVQIFIPNLLRKWYDVGEEKLDELERYLLTLVLQKKSDTNKVGGGNSVMEDYIKDATEASLDEELLVSYDKEKALYELGTTEGYKMGEKSGYEKGYDKKSKEIAEKLLKEGIDVEIISKTTGLSKEEIDKIRV
ncbi:MAG: Rpn family recombination-promoting nuclease/putative transposase [Bacilli bacterium]|nr:Rpn family recombination-promoting nuclease/putative transposase [Bacilli bacterium]